MNTDFMELLGNFLVTSAQNKKQSDQLFKWLQNCHTLTPENISTGGVGIDPKFQDLLLSMYGSKNSLPIGTETVQLTEDTIEKFITSMNETFQSMGFVPRSEHLALEEKYKKLQKEHEELKEKIDSL